MTSFYDGVIELYKTFDLKDANQHLKSGWVVCKVAEVDVPIEGSAGTYFQRSVAYVLGRREEATNLGTFPPPPPPPHGGPPSDKVTDKQLDYIKALEKRSQANAATIVKFLDDHHKRIVELTKLEANELIGLLAR